MKKLTSKRKKNEIYTNTGLISNQAITLISLVITKLVPTA